MGIMDGWGRPEYQSPAWKPPKPVATKKPRIREFVAPKPKPDPKPKPASMSADERHQIVKRMRKLGHGQAAIARRLNMSPREFAKLHPRIVGLDHAPEE